VTLKPSQNTGASEISWSTTPPSFKHRTGMPRVDAIGRPEASRVAQ